jgi:hypothetical protein
LMAMKTENSAILLFRFDYHFLLPWLGKVGSKPKDDAFHASGRLDVERPEAVGFFGLRFRFYKMGTTQMITQISTIVPISPCPNIVASAENTIPGFSLSNIDLEGQRRVIVCNCIP